MKLSEMTDEQRVERRRLHDEIRREQACRNETVETLKGRIRELGEQAATLRRTRAKTVYDSSMRVAALQALARAIGEPK